MTKYAETPCRMCGTHQTSVRGDWCRAQRTAAGLTLQALAQRAGLAVQTLWDVETGRMRCSQRVQTVYEALEVGLGMEQARVGDKATGRPGIPRGEGHVPSPTNAGGAR